MAVLPILIALPAFVSARAADGLVYLLFLLFRPGSAAPFLALLALVLASLLTFICSLLGEGRQKGIGLAYSFCSLVVEALLLLPAVLGVMGADIHWRWNH